VVLIRCEHGKKAMTSKPREMPASLERIPNETLKVWRAELSEWALPDVFRSRVDELKAPLFRDRLFFRRAGLEFLRDASIAGRVATALSCDAVRLVLAAQPDFEIECEGQIQQFEATGADKDGRRRGDEPEQLGWQPDSVENWRKRFEAIPAALDRVVAKKLGKKYLPGVSLVIYLNLGCYGAYVDEGLPILRQGTAPAKERFKVVFVMWEGILYKFWENGEDVFETWQFAPADDF
jgi:hypothetical protein